MSAFGTRPAPLERLRVSGAMRMRLGRRRSPIVIGSSSVGISGVILALVDGRTRHGAYAAAPQERRRIKTASRPSVALEHELVGPFGCGFALRGVAHRPGHDRRAVELLHQERDFMWQVVDAPGQEIGPQPVEMLERGPVAFLLG